MPLRPPHIDGNIIYARIQTIRRFDVIRANRLNGTTFYLKPNYLPFHREVWASKDEVFLPSDFPYKSEKHQLMDLFRASVLYSEQDIMKQQHGRFYFLFWIASRKIGYVRDGFNLRTRKLWRGFMNWYRFMKRQGRV